MYIYIYISCFICVCIYRYMYVYIYIYIYIYTYVYIYIYLYPPTHRVLQASETCVFVLIQMLVLLCFAVFIFFVFHSLAARDVFAFVFHILAAQDVCAFVLQSLAALVSRNRDFFLRFPCLFKCDCTCIHIKYIHTCIYSRLQIRNTQCYYYYI